jgi:hypothetical protein
LLYLEQRSPIFCGKVPNLLLWGGSQAPCVKIIVDGVPICLNTCDVCTGWSKNLRAPDGYSTKKHAKYFKQFQSLTINVDHAIVNTVFENTVRRVNKCLETGKGHWTLLVTFRIVTIRFTETFEHPV